MARMPRGFKLQNDRRFNLTITGEAYDILQNLAAKKGKSMTDTIRDSITLEKYVVEEVEKGARIILRMPDGTEKEIILG